TSKRCRRSVTHASMTSGRWSRVFPSRLSEPVTCRQTSCFASAQSRPMKAANSCVVPLVMCPLQSVMRASARDMPTCVGRRRYREPVRRQALSILGSTQDTGRFEAVWISIACSVIGIRNVPVHVLLSPKATSQVCPVSSVCRETPVCRRRVQPRKAVRFIYNMIGQTDCHRWGAWRVALPQAFLGHHKVIEADHQPEPAPVAGTAPGQTAGAAPQGGDQPSQGPIPSLHEGGLDRWAELS